MKTLEELLNVIGGELSEKNSLLSPVLRKQYVEGYVKVLPANTPDGKVRGVLFCHPGTGKVRFYGFSVHFRLPLKETCIVVKNYLDYVAVSSLSEELEFTPVLTAGPVGLTSLIWNLSGYKVDRPDYGRFFVLPVEEQAGLWKAYLQGPQSFKERLLDLIDAAADLDEELHGIRISDL